MTLIRTTAHDLARALAAADAHRAGHRDLDLDAVRLEIAPGALLAIGTDRYTLAAARADATTYGAQATAVLDGPEADRLLADARRLAGLDGDLETAVSIDTAEETLTLTSCGCRIEQTYLLAPADRGPGALDWRDHIDRTAAQVRPQAPVRLTPRLLGRFTQGGTGRMQVVASGEIDGQPELARAALVTVDDWLVG
ncbi:hypothetical protein, partial [Nocardiopsis potens]|uniref:hypothetical protein n=1 Tax=Nocardiopsis potens TaxID=1246458 RepID=UPI0005945AF4